MNDTRENSSQQNDLRQRVDRLEAQLNDKVDRLLYDESRSITDKKNEHDLERVKDHIDSISTGLHGYVKKRIFGIFAILLPVMAIITFFGIPTLFSMKLDREVDKHEDT